MLGTARAAGLVSRYADPFDDAARRDPLPAALAEKLAIFPFERLELVMRLGLESLLVQMQPNFVTHLEVMLDSVPVL